jgi:predicted nucleic acid-binding protein
MVARRTRNRALATEVGRATLEVPGLVIHALDHELAAEAAEIAAACVLRGADAVYVATARRMDTTLLTLDRELRKRAERTAEVRTPGEWRSAMA